VAWPVEPASRPQVVMGIPEEWGAWIVAAPSPAEDVVMAAGLGADGPWLRLLAPRDSTSRVLLEGEQVGGRPVDGAVSADGRRLLLVVAEPDAVRPDDAARWRLIEVDAIDATRRDTGIGGTVRVPAEGVRADVAADAGAVVVWDDTGTAPAMFVDVSTGRQTPIRAQQRPSASRGFRALPSGAAQFWHDGTVVLVDRAGTPVQELDAHTRPVEDVAVSPDGTWAVTAGDGAEVVRWEIESSTGRWVAPEVLAGHAAQVVGVEVDTSGRTLVTVSLDHTVIAWDMAPAGGRSTARPDDPAAWLAEACAVVGRDLTPAEWRHFLPALPWQATCTDGPVTQSPPGE
jgi:hypothetical protein